jgi:two-component sensor histidine kinase
MNPEQLLYFLWAGLITYHEELDGDLVNGKPDQTLAAGLKKVGKMLTMDKMSYIGNVIREAFTNATKVPSSRSEAKAKKQ